MQGYTEKNVTALVLLYVSPWHNRPVERSDDLVIPRPYRSVGRINNWERYYQYEIFFFIFPTLPAVLSFFYRKVEHDILYWCGPSP